VLKEIALNPRDRLKALSIVWTAFTLTVVGVALFTAKGEGYVVLTLGLALALMSLLATFMITRIPNADETADSSRISAKAKRSDTALIDRLIESMSDAELAALRKRLTGDSTTVGDDGEIVSLDELQAGRNSNGRKEQS
jgi:hypothetical protein